MFQKIDKQWLAIWIMIYASFLIGDFVAPGFVGVSAVKLLGIFLCFVYAYRKFRQDYLLVIALGLTMLADVILALDNVNEWGVFVFCFAHFFHLARLSNTDAKFLAFYASFVLLTFVFGSMVGIMPMLVIGFIYAVTLASNLWLALAWWRGDKENRRARSAVAGFLLFVACDVCVALSYFGVIGWLPAWISGVANYLAWAFYYPSQVFISNSSKSVVQYSYEGR